ncbi:MAG: hypothetical protein K6F35_07140 [Lachnospiraceae bacterium]|nr:hypothetical protein [Lachnospiraceae bacterium]
MKVVKIEKENESYFLPLLAPKGRKAAKNRIRLGIINDAGNAAAALSADVYDTQIDITSLYVAYGERHLGYASDLLYSLEYLLRGSDIEYMHAVFEGREDLTAFFGNRGFELFPDQDLYYFTLGELMRSSLFKRHLDKKKTIGAAPVASLSPLEKKAFDNVLHFDEFDPEWSTATMENGEYVSSLLCTAGEDCINILWLHSVKEDPAILLQHLRALVNKAMTEFPEKTDIRFRMIFEDDDLAKKLEILLGGHHRLHCYGELLHAILLLD